MEFESHKAFRFSKKSSITCHGGGKAQKPPLARQPKMTGNPAASNSFFHQTKQEGEMG
ncbi:hypothetical protein [Brucella sp. IR073]|uniref:hypothetical protein n=1 Tax=unclassified Brucella TaxID=2632610 RepID=UPI003B981687